MIVQMCFDTFLGYGFFGGKLAIGGKMHCQVLSGTNDLTVILITYDL